MIRVLSLGAGVQSTALLCMSVDDVVPLYDFAIFADTGGEPKKVYDHLRICEEECERAGIQFVKVSAGDLREQYLDALADDSKRYAGIPFHVKNPDGSHSMARRHCTGDYKIKPIETYMRRQILGLKPRERAPKEVVVEHHFGISYDEIMRVKDSQAKWKVHCYPFVGIGCTAAEDRMWKRHDCIKWLEENRPGMEVTRSACWYCPYHSNDFWRWLRDDNPDEWDQAVEFDAQIRRAPHREGKEMRGEQYLHRSNVPLPQADLRTDAEKGQPDLFNNECDGMCGA